MSNLVLSSSGGQSITIGKENNEQARIKVLGFFHDVNADGIVLKVSTPKGEETIILFEGKKFELGAVSITLEQIWQEPDKNGPIAKFSINAPNGIEVNRERIFQRKFSGVDLKLPLSKAAYISDDKGLLARVSVQEAHEAPRGSTSYLMLNISQNGKNDFKTQLSYDSPVKVGDAVIILNSMDGPVLNFYGPRNLRFTEEEKYLAGQVNQRENGPYR